MPNIKSAKKRVIVAAGRHDINIAQRSELKTSLKKTTTSIAQGDLETAKVNLQDSIKTLDVAASRGLIHKNQAARKKSRLTKRLNTLSK